MKELTVLFDPSGEVIAVTAVHPDTYGHVRQWEVIWGNNTGQFWANGRLQGSFAVTFMGEE